VHVPQHSTAAHAEPSIHPPHIDPLPTDHNTQHPANSRSKSAKSLLSHSDKLTPSSGTSAAAAARRQQSSPFPRHRRTSSGGVGSPMHPAGVGGALGSGLGSEHSLEDLQASRSRWRESLQSALGAAMTKEDLLVELQVRRLVGWRGGGHLDCDGGLLQCFWFWFWICFWKLLSSQAPHSLYTQRSKTIPNPTPPHPPPPNAGGRREGRRPHIGADRSRSAGRGFRGLAGVGGARGLPGGRLQAVEGGDAGPQVARGAAAELRAVE